jgi:hypothetical protein
MDLVSDGVHLQDFPAEADSTHGGQADRDMTRTDGSAHQSPLDVAPAASCTGDFRVALRCGRVERAHIADVRVIVTVAISCFEWAAERVLDLAA